MERDCCEFICGAPTTFQGYGIEYNRKIDRKVQLSRLVIKFGLMCILNDIQSTLVISTSVISNNRLSRRKNLVLVITQKSKIRL